MLLGIRIVGSDRPVAGSVQISGQTFSGSDYGHHWNGVHDVHK